MSAAALENPGYSRLGVKRRPARFGKEPQEEVAKARTVHQHLCPLPQWHRAMGTQ